MIIFAKVILGATIRKTVFVIIGINKKLSGIKYLPWTPDTSRPPTVVHPAYKLITTAAAAKLNTTAKYIRIVLFCTFFTIASKFLIRYNEKHIFNPNNFSIVLTLFMFPSIAKVAPYQWGLESWSFAIFIIIVGFLISRSVRSYDLAIYFLSLYSFSMFIFSFMGLYNGNLFLHIMSIPITLFSFFMITDPKVIPNTTEGRFIFAVITVTISNILYIFTNLTPPFIFALPVSSLITPLIDSYFLGKNFQWNK
jgi:Na+-transporting NADH:ubiquinone oxidoreductase subunit NqrB